MSRKNQKTKLSFDDALKKFASDNNFTVMPNEIKPKIDKTPYSTNNADRVHQSNNQAAEVSKAPYNFVPVNEKIVEAEKVPQFNQYHNDRFTGYLDLDIETITPVYIRDTLTKSESENKEIINPDFYSPGGRLKIPGSSLRGLTKTMVEILSFSKFGSFEDKQLYFRDFTKLPLRKIYSGYNLSSTENYKDEKGKERKKIKYNMQCGLLKKQGLNYKIQCCGNPERIKTIKVEEIFQKYEITYEDSEWNYQKIGDQIIVISTSLKNRQGKSKKREWLITIPENPELISLDEQDIWDYTNDISRECSQKVPDLLEEVKKNPKGIPVFYIEYSDKNSGTRIAFGHTGMFRLPYKKTIGEHVPVNHKNDSVTDFAEAVFGNATTFASRVFFEDALCTEEDSQKVLMGVRIPPVLSSPKPTSFQNYLEQDNNNKENLNHYNSDASVRGNKMYWHRDAGEIDWIDNSKYNKKINTKINPVKPGTLFKGKIRFENLSGTELGALISALNLPGNFRHKIGMAKPLGLGTIKVTVALNLSDRKKRYSDLFTEWNPGNVSSPEEAKLFQDKFEKYILNALEEKKSSVWEIDRINQLKVMLDYNNKPCNEDTRYQTIEPNEFKKRNILPGPEKVIKKNVKR